MSTVDIDSIAESIGSNAPVELGKPRNAGCLPLVMAYEAESIGLHTSFCLGKADVHPRIPSFPGLLLFVRLASLAVKVVEAGLSTYKSNQKKIKFEMGCK